MTTTQFLNLLQNHPDRMLQFEYQPGSRLRPDYHITEVKNVHIDATDCGGRTDSWKETVIQLWESPAPEPGTRSITTRKALAILDRVNRVRPLLLDHPLKFEYGNPDFPTRQLRAGSHRLQDGFLILDLLPETTQCKARELCGTPEPEESATAAPCAPGSGCC